MWCQARPNQSRRGNRHGPSSGADAGAFRVLAAVDRPGTGFGPISASVMDAPRPDTDADLEKSAGSKGLKSPRLSVNNK
jgi:hypothetical protein